MNHIAFTEKGNLLRQEAFLVKNTLLSSFDLLLQANFYQDREGYYYSAFFHLSIGIERLLKLAIVSDYILKNEYKTPSIAFLKSPKECGHNVSSLYDKCIEICKDYSIF